MNGKSGYKISAVFVCLKLGFWGPVGPHCLEDLGDAGAPAFGELQFFQKLSYPSIPITSGYKTAGSQVRQPDGTVGTRIADDGKGIGQDPDLYGFPDFITAVINGVDHGLFDGGKGIILEAVSLGAVRSFNQENIFLNQIFYDRFLSYTLASLSWRREHPDPLNHIKLLPVFWLTPPNPNAGIQ
jgi:hypothetical protein